MVVKRHPRGLLAGHLGWLCTLPEIIRGELFEALDGVPAPPTVEGVAPETECGAEYGAGGRGHAVSATTQPKDKGREEENYSRERIRKIVTHILRHDVQNGSL